MRVRVCAELEVVHRIRLNSAHNLDVAGSACAGVEQNRRGFLCGEGAFG
ncbi:hypothetical protein SAMN05421642_11287 [Rhodococcoides kyotonense]|uniref:Uncharacterized protein n=1 Tax=Rhodococcoides kyotonense TaxID=398843 RepID=A0A239L984_9NOCA|nr:hypothetical protein SAMN05421642_11287 [Rhodococcus kyotonensis]